MIRPTQDQRRGFSLVELLVVFAVIGVLVALLLPAIQAARESAKHAVCCSNLRQIGVGIYGYHDSFKVLPPTEAQIGGSSGTYVTMYFLLAPYVEGQSQSAGGGPIKIYQCPSRRSGGYAAKKVDYAMPDSGLSFYSFGM